MFTEGQKDRMLAALNSNVSGRNNLWSEYTMNYTGAALSNNTNTAPPIADFNLENKSTCIGKPVTIKDFSWRGPITNWEWTFDNATPSVSNDKNPTVSFNNTGWQKVSLTVTNANGTHTTVKENFIFVRDNFVQQFRENFEDATFVANNYVPENYANNESKWQLTDKASYTGGLSYMLNNFDVGIYDIDAFVTPEYDLSASFVSDLSFKYSLATKAAYADEIKDRLRVFYSIDCGETWRLMYNEQGLQLITAGNTTQNFVPNREEQWREVRVQIPNLALNNGSAMFKFEFTRDRYTNNLYIDDINIDEAYTSINETSGKNTNLSVYPNPTRGNVTVSLNIPNSENGNVKIFDMTGKLVFETNKSFSAGENKFSINEKLSSGIYQLNVLAGKNTFQKKLQIIAE
jgi:PKD repeat protein